MCHDWWMDRAKRREKRFDEQLRYLLDAREHAEPPAPIAEYEHDEEPGDPERPRVEAGTGA